VGSVPRRARLARASVGAGNSADIVPQKKKNVRHSIGSIALQGSVGEKSADITPRQQSFGESVGIFPQRKSRHSLGSSSRRMGGQQSVGESVTNPREQARHSVGVITSRQQSFGESVDTIPPRNVSQSVGSFPLQGSVAEVADISPQRRSARHSGGSGKIVDFSTRTSTGDSVSRKRLAALAPSTVGG